MHLMTPALVFALALTACAPLEVQRAEFAPALIDVSWAEREYTSGVCLLLNRAGAPITIERQWLADGGLSAAGPIAGYGSHRRRSNNALSCDTWLHQAAAAQVLFNLRSLPQNAVVRAATLEITTRLQSIPGAAPVDLAAQCGFDLGVGAAAAVGTDPASGPPFSYRLARPDASVALAAGAVANRRDVTGAVFDWVSGRRGNLGFVIAPRNELLFNEHEAPGNAITCAIYLSNMRLLVDYAVPAAP